MATVTKTIKPSGEGGDYTSPASWVGDLDDASIYSSGDLAIGLVAGSHELTEELLINTGGTIGLTQTRLTVAESDRHDGTAGNGARFTFNMAGTKVLRMASSTASHVQRTCEWVEFDWEETEHSGDEWIYITNNAEGTGRLNNFSHNLLHSLVAKANSACRVVWGHTYMCAIHNNILYDVTSDNSIFTRGICGQQGFQFLGCNTTYNVRNSGTGPVYGQWTGTSIFDNVINNISVGSSGTTSADFSTSLGNQTSNNLSSDTSAPGTSGVTGASASDLFVSTMVGSEDLHLKAGAAAIGSGRDIGTSFTSTIHGGVTVASSAFGTAINYDIDNYDREDAEKWDIGADQFVASATTNAAFLLFLDS